MFNILTLFRKNPHRFLGNARATDEWLTTLKEEDEYEGQKKLNLVLADYVKGKGPLSRERLKVLMRLDESSQVFQKSLARTFFHHPTGFSHAEDALWKSVASLYSHLARGYELFARDIAARRGKSECSRYLPTVTARALHYYAQSIKWGYFRQEPVQPAMWRRLHKYYLMCESAHFAAREVSLGNGVTTTCGNEYVQILLLDIIKPMALKPAQTELVDHWLDLWSHLVRLERDCDVRTHMHCVDLSTGVGARKLLPEMHGASLRCWSMVDLYMQIRKSRTGLSEGEWSEHVALGDQCVLPDCINLLDYVARYWIRPEAARRQFRAPVEDKMVQMACGVGAIHSCLRPEERAGRHIPYEHWAVQDESEGGYGLVEARPTERAGEGKLVLVKPPGPDGTWEIGVVRWKKDTESGLPALGIERLSDDPKQVHLVPAEEGGEGKEIRALFLPKLYQRDIDSSLILQAPDYREGRTLEMHYRNNLFHIRLTEVVDNGEDWIRVHFAVLGNRSRKAA